jgi:tripartite-type tricarboxylate transporter receptor subunit TctC
MQTKLRDCLFTIVVAGAGAASMLPAAAQGWKPERSVELTIPTSPGGSNDIAGRLIHRLWNELKLLPVASSVVNRSGGEHSVAYTYIQQRAADPYAIGSQGRRGYAKMAR